MYEARASLQHQNVYLCLLYKWHILVGGSSDLWNSSLNNICSNIVQARIQGRIVTILELYCRCSNWNAHARKFEERDICSRFFLRFSSSDWLPKEFFCLVVSNGNRWWPIDSVVYLGRKSVEILRNLSKFQVGHQRFPLETLNKKTPVSQFCTSYNISSLHFKFQFPRQWATWSKKI